MSAAEFRSQNFITLFFICNLLFDAAASLEADAKIEVELKISNRK